MTTAYILIAIQLEERDLVAEHGVEYETYRRRVPMLVPGTPTTKASVSTDRFPSRGVVTKHLLILIVPCLTVVGLESSSASAQGRRRFPGSMPSVPLAIEAPAGHSLFFKVHATGTQNYMCLPKGAGLAWKPIGPQATLFHTFTGDVRLQLATHFSSANASENGVTRPTWQHSFDSSRVWGRPIGSSTDPAFVEPDAVPWLLLERAGSEPGPGGGSLLTEARYIQRLNTSGGIAAWAGCAQTADVGSMAWVPYDADYFFYKASRY